MIVYMTDPVYFPEFKLVLIILEFQGLLEVVSGLVKIPYPRIGFNQVHIGR